MSFPTLKSLAIQNISHPVVIKGFITKWSLLNWNLEDWAIKFGDRVLPFRVGSNDEASVKGEPIWERNCSTEYMTFKEFMNWESGPDGLIKKKWMYFDYKYMHEWFEDDPDFLKAIDWGCLGFHGRNGQESTLWVGSHGAHTPCHADTYGFNLVAQLYGRKRWLLFPPDSKQLLHRASRIPYEESSIYVQGCVGGGEGGARGIVLSPGEVLVVPRRWWHRVDTDGGISISVNTWVPSEQDNAARLEESLVRFLFASTLESLPLEWQKSFLNPNEDDLPSTSLADNLIMVRQTVEACTTQFQQTELPLSPDTGIQVTTSGKSCFLPNRSPPMKRMKPTVKVDCLQKADESGKPCVRVVPLVGSDGWHSWDQNDTKSPARINPQHENSEILQRILNAFCHPEVISLVSQKMLANSLKSHCTKNAPPQETGHVSTSSMLN
ncbi:HSPB1-associated protein 1 homolog [Hetaerina americana]|uniref:HSPB1-associated protein 1 homolog n=1 Tax=Hetaerina americana TaxID=62018 RepID=UPI003A7F4CA1